MALDPPRGQGTALSIAPEAGPGAGAQPFPSHPSSKWKRSSKTNHSKTGPCLEHLPGEQPEPHLRPRAPHAHMPHPAGRGKSACWDDAVSLYPGPRGAARRPDTEGHRAPRADPFVPGFVLRLRGTTACRVRRLPPQRSCWTGQVVPAPSHRTRKHRTGLRSRQGEPSEIFSARQNLCVSISES